MVAKILLMVLVALLLASGSLGYTLNTVSAEREKIVADSQVEVADFQVKISELSDQITVLAGEKKILEGGIGNLQKERTEIQGKVLEKEAEITDLQEQLNVVPGQLATVRDTAYDKGYEKGKESVLPRKPTYAEVKELLATRYQVWAVSPNMCAILSMESAKRWKEKGLKVGIAALFFLGTGSHMVTVFDTVDRGEVYVELLPNEGEGTGLGFREIKAEEGKSYTKQNGLGDPGFDDRIWTITTMW